MRPRPTSAAVAVAADAALALRRWGLGRADPSRRFSRREAAAVVSRLAALTAAGMTTSEALQASARRRGPVAARLASATRRGVSLSRAMGGLAATFTEAEVALVRAGEAGGSTPRALALLSARMEHEREGRRRIASALVYPCILVGGALAALAFLSIAVLPSFVSLYAASDVAMPLSTRALLAFGAWIADHGAASLIAVGGAATAVVALRGRSRRLRRLLDRASLRVPPLAGIAEPRALGEAASLIAALLAAGCDAEDALALAGRAASNGVIAARIGRCLASLRHGVAVSRAWTGAGLDPSGDAGALLEIAEATGGYADAFARIAALESDAAERALALLCRLAEPTAVLFMAAAVGGGVLALYQPMLGSASLLLGGSP